MMITDNLLLLATLSMGGLGVVFSIFLGIADKKLRVEEDPRVEAAFGILPGVNCGACGLPSCHVFAERVVDGGIPVNGCLAGGEEVAKKLGELLGVETPETQRLLAVVLCKGGDAEAVMEAEYFGERSCEAAQLTGGGKACIYGCLGYGDCVRACPFDAIDMNENSIPVVFYDACVGCGKCAEACPRNIIEMHPEAHKLFVYCRNRDKGAVARKVCKVACVACTLCVKDCEVEGGIEIKDNLAVVNYDRCVESEAAPKRCPTKCIFNDIERYNTKDSFYEKMMRKEAV